MKTAIAELQKYLVFCKIVDRVSVQLLYMQDYVISHFCTVNIAGTIAHGQHFIINFTHHLFIYT